MLAKKLIMNAVESGMSDASKRWQDIFGDEPKEDILTEKGKKRRNEQFYSSFVAEHLRRVIHDKKAGGYVTHETHHFVIEQAIRSSNSSHSDHLFGFVYDLVLWNENNRPYAVIEVKLPFRWFDLKRDAEKISTLVSSAGTSSGGTIKNVFITFPLYERSTISSEQSYLDSHAGLNSHLIDKKMLRPEMSLGKTKNPEGKNRLAGVFRISSKMVF